MKPTDDISHYIKCMEQVRERLKLIQKVTTKEVSTGSVYVDIELVFLNLRKILELIAFASLTANREKYAAVQAKFASHWRAKDLLADLEKINPEFYPMPLGHPQELAPGRKRFPPVSGEFLTKDDFKFLYNCCGDVLHVRNPFTDKPSTVNVLYPVPEWISRISNLIGIHMMHLVGGNRMIIVVPEKGPISVGSGVTLTTLEGKSI